MRTLAVVGAGPKGIAIAAKARALAAAGLPAPRVVLVDRGEVAGNWTGRQGYTSGLLPLGTPPEKDVGYPYAASWGDASPGVVAAMAQYSWQRHLIRHGVYSDWVDRRRMRPTHRQWSAYLREVSELAETEIVRGVVTGLEVADGGRWEVTLEAGGVMAADGVVITGAGPAITVPGQPRDHPRVLDGRTYWLAAHTLARERAVNVCVVGSLELLQPFADALDPRRGVIRLDMPGVGGSPAPVLPYHLGTSAPLLAGLLDQLGYPQGDVLGISWGGGLAQQFALSRPDRVRRLVLVATGPGALMVPGHPRVLLRMLTPRRHRDPGHAARIAGALYGGSAREDPIVARDLLHATSRLGPPRGYYYQLISGAGWTSLPWLPRLRQPTLILAGDDDPIIPLANARIMHRLIPRSELHIYHGGHLELAADAERIAPVVEAFLDAGPTVPESQARKGSQR